MACGAAGSTRLSVLAITTALLGVAVLIALIGVVPYRSPVAWFVSIDKVEKTD